MTREDEELVFVSNEGSKNLRFRRKRCNFFFSFLKNLTSYLIKMAEGPIEHFFWCELAPSQDRNLIHTDWQRSSKESKTEVPRILR